MIKGILFDYHGVFTDEKKEVVRQRMYELFNFKFVELPKELQKDFRRLDYDEIKGRTLWKKMRHDYNIPLKGNMFGFDWLIRYFPKVKFNRELYKLVKKLEKKGYKVCLVSNTFKFHSNLFRLFGKYRAFKKEVLSHKVSYAKPDKEIYQLALKKIGLKASEVVFVDDRKRNTDGAEAVGIKGIIFKDYKQLKKDLISLGINL